MLGITAPQFLGLTVIAALVTVAGNLAALYLKEFYGARSLEHWKARQSLVFVFNRYRKPICMAAEELSGRCYGLATRSSGWRASAGSSLIRNINPDARYLRYKLLSDAYRLCCFLGWIELYRRDRGLLDAGAEGKNRALDASIRSLRSFIADGQLNRHPDRSSWYDALIFREEQRAIGHRMINSSGGGVIDFGTFCERLEDEASGSGRWFILAVHFFSFIKDERDFRRTRMKRLVLNLAELRELLEPGSVPMAYLEGNKGLRAELEAQDRDMLSEQIRGALPEDAQTSR